jgi:UDP:flavonoid glycosyltransferase YjiC (YdhE family)
MLSPASLRLAVRLALSRPALARRARAIAEWAAAHDGALTAARLVEQLAIGEF